MTATEILNLLMRWTHILAAMIAAGGTFYVRFALLPAQDAIGPEQRQSLGAALRRRWSKIVALAIAGLLISGLYNIAMIEMHTTAPKLHAWYRPIFMAKFVMALAVFVIASLLSGRTSAAEAVRRKSKLWLNVNVALIVAIVLLSGVLRTAEKLPKPAKASVDGVAQQRAATAR